LIAILIFKAFRPLILLVYQMYYVTKYFSVKNDICGGQCKVDGSIIWKIVNYLYYYLLCKANFIQAVFITYWYYYLDGHKYYFHLGILFISVNCLHYTIMYWIKNNIHMTYVLLLYDFYCYCSKKWYNRLPQV